MTLIKFAFISINNLITQSHTIFFLKIERERAGEAVEAGEREKKAQADSGLSREPYTQLDL